jgi:isoleucyl-tRNA synthetase
MANDEIYQDYKIVPWACDSQTVLSNSELEQGYKEVEHNTMTVKFRIDDDTNTYLIAWTTTPWTLPANMALAVNPSLTYYETIDSEGCHCISLKKTEPSLPISGHKLVGLKYRHPFISGKVCQVYGDNFVRGDTGTGIVHIAPAFGIDDYALWKKSMALEPIICHVNPDGSFNAAAPDLLRGINLLDRNFKTVNSLIHAHLTSAGANYENQSFKDSGFTHQYPHNWRTGKPLIYMFRHSWFVKTTGLKLRQVNKEEVTWYPSNIKEGRFGQWLDGGKDWAISRERFWGTPLPFYRDADNNVSFQVPQYYHKPGSDTPIVKDRVIWKRTSEVLDCWFDSGAMPFAAYEKFQPADVICEGIDQTRGWFYSLMVIGVALTEHTPFKAAICLGHVLDKNGVKMSKSKKNAVDPWEVFEREGADAVRWYMLKTPIGQSLLWNEAEVKKVNQTFFNRLLSSLDFYEQQQNPDKPHRSSNGSKDATDIWMMARLHSVVNSVSQYLEDYEFAKAIEAIELFTNDLSNVWIRTNRSRFLADGAHVPNGILKNCLKTLTLLIAPLAPMLAEHVWYRLCPENIVYGSMGSVHATDWPKPEDNTWDAFSKNIVILEAMKEARQVITEGLKQRDKRNIRLRQPIKAVRVPRNINPQLIQFVKTELNVKDIIVDAKGESVEMDFNLTDELVAEGMARDLMRAIQVRRKDLGLKRGEPIRIVLEVDKKTRSMLEPHMSELMLSVTCGDLRYKEVADTASPIVMEVTKMEPANPDGYKEFGKATTKLTSAEIAKVILTNRVG